MAESREMRGPHGGGRSSARPKNFKKTAFRILSYLTDSTKKKFLLALVLLLVIIASGSTIAATYLLTPAINEGILPLVGKTLTASSLAPFIKIMIIMGIIYACGAVAMWLYNYIMVQMSARILQTIRAQMFAAMEELPLRYFDTNAVGDTMSRYTNDVDTLREALSNALPQIFAASLTIIGTLVMMIILSWHLTLIILVMVVVMAVAVKLIGTQSAKGFKAQQKELGAVDGYIEEMIEGQKVVKIFNHEDAVIAEFDTLNDSLRGASTRANTFGNIMMPVIGNLSYVQYALVAGFGGWLLVQGTLSLGAIGSFLQYSRSFSQPITQISQLVNVLLSAMAGAERIFTLIDEAPEEDEGSVTLVNVCKDQDGKLSECGEVTQTWAWKIPDANGFHYNEIKGDVRFNDVSFSYDGKREILHDISLFAKPGQKIALVGSTGAGKTTITNLLNRFYEIDGGTITNDGVDLKDIKKADLRKSLAMVLQDTHLFTGTIMDNIRYGNLKATDAEVKGAANLAHATAFIEQLPDGFETVITDDGGGLSQGERQLLAIARAAVANPPVLVLDEATSSIDTMTEELIQKGMDSLMADRTVFVIAHRLSTVRNANAILVLENGKIIERGDHDELMDKKGRYYALQTGQAELD